MHSILNVVRENYPALASRLQGPLVDLLSLSRETFGGDTDKFLVMLVIAIRTTQHPDYRGMTPEELFSGDIAVFPSLGANVRSIAASVGIPKETVRRKVSELVEAGWLVRDGNRLFVTATAHRAVTPVREAIERMAVRYFEAVSEAVLKASHPDVIAPRAPSTG